MVALCVSPCAWSRELQWSRTLPREPRLIVYEAVRHGIPCIPLLHEPDLRR
jgi:hypothetical protein